ncbi:MAG TPA: hypothetical protein PK078_01010 [Anaerolineales bacterium]|nr:hypothetical protein [Anaerolineales bacterium]
MKAQRPFVMIVALILLVSLACSTLTGGASQPEAVEEPDAAAADTNPSPQTPPEVLPSATPEQATEVVPTDTPASTGPYFTEEFDSDPQWDYIAVKDETNAKQVDSDPESVTTKFSNGRMIFNIPEEWLSAFYTYTGETYEDVRLDMEVENRGVSAQQVSLVCRSSGDKSYEIEVSSNGKWIFKLNRRQVINGASTAIKTGKETNQYTLICKGNEVTFLFNGTEPKGSPFIDNQAALGAGNVGFVVTSKRAIPVDVEITWFKVSEP